MFEKADPVSASLRVPLMRRTEDGARLRHAVAGLAAGSFESRPARRAGDALRAVEWSEITARLNAARDLRLLLRSESHVRIEAEAASFGDAAATYFAMVEAHEPAINLDPLGAPKDFDGNESTGAVVRHEAASGGDAENDVDEPEGDARIKQ